MEATFAYASAELRSNGVNDLLRCWLIRADVYMELRMCGVSAVSELCGSSYCDLLKPLGMGSRQKFSNEECVQCGAEMEPCYRAMYLCPECEIQRKAMFLVPLLRRPLKQEPDHGLVEIIAQFAAVNRIWRCRMFFLRNVLLSSNSVFRCFTYFWGGLAGNVSETEDLVDKIMSFVSTEIKM